jgi:D-amino-acid dehydrogenase
MRVIVVGGGVVGVTTAYELTRDGHEVTLIERQPAVALECSHANGGYVAVSQAVPWSAPGVPLATLLGLLSRDAPILLSAAQIPAIWRWGLAFLNCSRATPSWENTRHVLRLALYSHAVLKQTRAAEALRYDALAQGCLKVFREPAALAGAIATSEAQRSLGLKYRRLTAAECARLVPALAPRAAELSGGLYYGDEECGDCYGFTCELARLCGARGVNFQFGVKALAFDRDGDRLTGVATSTGMFTADAVILAAGADSPLLARSLGFRLPIVPVKGYSLTFPRSLWPEAPHLPVLDEKRKFGYAPLGSDRLRMTGFAEISGYGVAPEPARTRAFAKAFIDLFPQLESRIQIPDLEPFCCLRPVTPTGLPILGRSHLRNLHFNVGHGHLGWTLAHGSARIVAAELVARPSDIDVTPYLYGR